MPVRCLTTVLLPYAAPCWYAVELDGLDNLPEALDAIWEPIGCSLNGEQEQVRLVMWWHKLTGT